MDNQIEYIVSRAISDCDPESSVKKLIDGRKYLQPPVIVAIGKAAVAEARGAAAALGGRFAKGLIVTKYGHANSAPKGFCVYEAGHPIPDSNTLAAANAVTDAVKGLSGDDTVILLVSGGGSALFEKPLIPLERLAEITRALMNGGCGIEELNTVRKRLSAVKGGKFAKMCFPARVENYLLSDVLGDDPTAIASGVGVYDSKSGDAASTVKKYGISPSEEEMRLLSEQLPQDMGNTEIHFTGNIEALIRSAKSSAEKLGYKAQVITNRLTGEASLRGKEFARFLTEERKKCGGEKRAYIMGGETTVTVKGDGKGGRNQEFALAAAEVLDGTRGIKIFAFGSDGTDGPTDNAGGFADGDTASKIREKGGDLRLYLENNDSAAALSLADALIITGPTGTNVNDLYMGLLNG